MGYKITVKVTEKDIEAGEIIVNTESRNVAKNVSQLFGDRVEVEQTRKVEFK